MDALTGSRHRRVAAATARTVGARSEATAASPARGRLPHPRSPRGVARCSAPVWPSLRMTGRGSAVAPLGPSRRRPTRPFPSRLLRTSGKKRSRRRARRVGPWEPERAPLHSSVAPGGRRSVWRKGTSSPHSVLRDAAPLYPSTHGSSGRAGRGRGLRRAGCFDRLSPQASRCGDSTNGRGGAARTRGGLTGGYNADIAAWGEALPDSKSPIGRGSPSIEEWTRFMGASPLRRFALARLCLTSNL